MVVRGTMTRAMVVKRLEAGLRGGIVSPAAQRQLGPRKILLGCPSNGQDRDAKKRKMVNYHIWENSRDVSLQTLSDWARY